MGELLWLVINIRKNVLGYQKTTNFQKLTMTQRNVESKIQRCVRKLKSKITKDEYSKRYPTDSKPGKLYGTSKIHNFPIMTPLINFRLYHLYQYWDCILSSI